MSTEVLNVSLFANFVQFVRLFETASLQPLVDVALKLTQRHLQSQYFSFAALENVANYADSACRHFADVRQCVPKISNKSKHLYRRLQNSRNATTVNGARYYPER